MTRRRLRQSDAGSASLFFVVVMIAFIALIGLIVDGGGKIRASEHADDIAAQAARQGGQAVLADTAIRGTTIGIDTAKAQQAAQSYLAAAGVAGSVTVSGANTLTVDTTITYSPVILTIIGIGPSDVHGHAVVILKTGV